MDRKVFCLLSSLLVSGLSACTYDDGGVDNQNGKPGATTDDINVVFCSTSCPSGYFCDAKSKGCVERYLAGEKCEDSAMCKSGSCGEDKQCTCSENSHCNAGKVCRDHVCTNSDERAIGEPCSLSSECISVAFCDTAAGVCKAKNKIGDGCSRDEECVDDAYCKGSRCKAFSKGGEECDNASECVSNVCTNNVCGCEKNADCQKDSVCDAGLCRKVIPCPSDSGKKCFQTLSLTPPEGSWNIGKITPDENDIAGGVFDVYLPKYRVVTCGYPEMVQNALKTIISAIPGVTLATQGYCELDEHKVECAKQRTQAGCYLIEADHKIPFTLVLKKDKWAEQWSNHSFFLGLKLKTPEFVKDDMKFTMLFAPSYSTGNASISSVANVVRAEFPKKESSEVAVYFDHSKCNSETSAEEREKGFLYDAIVSGTSPEQIKAEAEKAGFKACDTAYQFMFEPQARIGVSLLDQMLTYEMGSMSMGGKPISISLCTENDSAQNHLYTDDELMLKNYIYSSADSAIKITPECLTDKKIDPKKGTIFKKVYKFGLHRS